MIKGTVLELFLNCSVKRQGRLGLGSLIVLDGLYTGR